MGFDVAVVGSVNQDLIVRVGAHPRAGETVLGSGHSWGAGGKGANQAVAAARLGSKTAFIGCLGEDEAGRSLLQSLETEGIDLGCAISDPSSPTGLAVITLDRNAENSIVVSPGANMRLSPDHLSRCSSTVEDARVVLAQLEIPLEVVAKAAAMCANTFCLNPAPARALPGELLGEVDVLIPNLGELASLASADRLTDRREVIEAARRIDGPRAVVVTLGSEGALVVEPQRVVEVEPIPVVPVDTTGAGDAFCGALADALARDADLVEAAQWAALAGGLATTRMGAQSAMPTRAEMESRR